MLTSFTKFSLRSIYHERMKKLILRWFDNEYAIEKSQINDPEGIDWRRIMPFVALHLGCFLVIWAGVSWTAIWVLVASYLIRMFAITAFFHRFFSHKTFQAKPWLSRTFAVIGATATQRGPLWWAAHHRHHHVHSDQVSDSHSPRHGFWNSHMLWFLREKNFKTQTNRVPDLNKDPFLTWVDRHDMFFPFIYAILLWLLGTLVALIFPDLGTSGLQWLVWGYFISTVLLSHVTYTINSLSHVIGKKEYNTNDDSRNHWLLAILTLGEGWHNNHHCYPGSAKQGFTFWQIDVSYYLLKLMERLGWVWDLKQPNPLVLESKRIRGNA